MLAEPRPVLLKWTIAGMWSRNELLRAPLQDIPHLADCSDFRHEFALTLAQPFVRHNTPFCSSSFAETLCFNVSCAVKKGIVLVIAVCFSFPFGFANLHKYGLSFQTICVTNFEEYLVKKERDSEKETDKGWPVPLQHRRLAAPLEHPKCDMLRGQRLRWHLSVFLGR